MTPEDPTALVLAGSRTAFVAHGDCRKRLKELPDNSIDAVVTDPPAGIEFMGKEWDSFKKKESTASGQQTDSWGSMAEGKKNPYAREGTPRYRGKKNESLQGFQDFICEVFTEVYRVLKPGGHAVVWALPRTAHHTTMGVERAGFEIRDVVHHLFGTGFPKSLDVSKALAKTGHDADWQGWGTALKPAAENWILARKPLIGTVAANVLEHGTGGINIDGCRVGYEEECRLLKGGSYGGNRQGSAGDSIFGTGGGEVSYSRPPLGRWPANLIHDGSDEVVGLFPETTSGALNAGHKRGSGVSSYDGGGGVVARDYGGDSVSAARFFYVAKAPGAEKSAVMTCGCTPKLKIKDIPVISMKEAKAATGQPCPVCGEKQQFHAHPTVKSVSLMEWLVKLVTPPGGVVLDPFTGSGTTGVAARRLGFRFIGMEQDKVYCALARHRIK